MVSVRSALGLELGARRVLRFTDQRAQTRLASTAYRQRPRSGVAHRRQLRHRRRHRRHCGNGFGYVFHVAYAARLGNARTQKAHFRRKPCVTFARSKHSTCGRRGIAAGTRGLAAGAA